MPEIICDNCGEAESDDGFCGCYTFRAFIGRVTLGEVLCVLGIVAGILLCLYADALYRGAAQ